MAENLFNNYPRPSIENGGATTKGITLTTVGSASSNSTSFTISATSQENLWFVDVQLADVIVTFDGTTPNPGVNGHRLYLGTNYTWARGTLQAAKFVAATGTSAFLMASGFQP